MKYSQTTISRTHCLCVCLGLYKKNTSLALHHDAKKKIKHAMFNFTALIALLKTIPSPSEKKKKWTKLHLSTFCGSFYLQTLPSVGFHPQPPYCLCLSLDLSLQCETWLTFCFFSFPSLPLWVWEGRLFFCLKEHGMERERETDREMEG